MYAPVKRSEFSLSLVNFTNLPQHKLSHLVYVFSQIVNSEMCDGRWTCRSRNLSWCRGQIAFRWYLPISIPYLLRRTSSFLSIEAHTCLHLLNRKYHFSTLSIRRNVVGDNVHTQRSDPFYARFLRFVDVSVLMAP